MAGIMKPMGKAALILICVTLFLFSSCTSHREEKPHFHGLTISEVHPDKKTALVKQNLLHLAQVYDLRPLFFTKNIEINTHPSVPKPQTLSIDTKFAEHPNKLLSQWLHGELHFWILLNSKKSKLAVADLKKIYPRIPVEIRPGDKVSGYAHLIICYLELETLSFYLGKKESLSIISELMKKHKIFPWVYYQVINKNFVIKQVVEKHQLLPPPLI